MPTHIRSYQPNDQPAISDICYQTGYMGESMGGRFQDQVLFALLFAQPYLVYAPTTCWVAVIDASVVGYCLTVADTRTYQRWHRRIYRRSVLRHVVMATLWHYPKDVLRVLCWDTAPRLKTPSDLFDSYPAHCHINVSPQYQHQGIGRMLMAAAFEHLQVVGTPGVHLRTTSRNSSALTFYQQQGFSTLAVGASTMWRAPGVQAILMGKRI